jgi:hypothetical protein
LSAVGLVQPLHEIGIDFHTGIAERVHFPCADAIDRPVARPPANGGLASNLTVIPAKSCPLALSILSWRNSGTSFSHAA